MKCPTCSNSLTEMKVGDVTVDVCQDGCSGMWFDNFELKKFDESHEHQGESLLSIKKAGIKVDNKAKRRCPRCNTIIMIKHFFSVKHRVEVDECAQCGGIWLDAGELGEIRSLFKNEKERREAADKYFSDLFAGSLAEMEEKSEKDLEKARKFANMFKFLCPSYYIPGKQTGGAF